MKTRTLLLSTVLAACTGASAQAQLLSSFETSFDGWAEALFPTSREVLLDASGFGATDGAFALSVRQFGDGFSWNIKRDSGPGDAFYTAINNAVVAGRTNYLIELDVTYRNDDIPDGSVTFVNLSIAFNSDAGFKEVHGLATTSGSADETLHISVPLGSWEIAPDSSFLQMVIAFNGNWGGGDAGVYLDNIRLSEPPSLDYRQRFNNPDFLSAWVHWWGGAIETREFDPAMDADGDPSSGSMKVTVPYSRSLGDNQFSMWGSFSGMPETWNSPLDGTTFTNIEMDIYWDPSSPTRPSTGDYGSDFRYGFAVGAPQYAQISFNNHTTIATNDVGKWIHLSSPIDLVAVGNNITNIVGIWLKMWTGNDPMNSLNDGNAVFWVDNIRLRSKATNAPPADPPTLTLEPPGARGLRLFANAPGAQYQRQGIRTLNPAYSWVGAFDPVTYSVTIADHPGVTSFQTHIFLVPGDNIPVGDNAPDYGRTNVVFLDIQANADGTANATFRYKIDEPNGNSFLYGAGSIASVGSSTILGTWNLTFNPGGDISLSSPSGGVTNFVMPSEAVARFAGPLYAYFGVQPNQPANIGRSAVLSRVQITGVGAPIDETFAAPLDPATWEVSAQSADGVVLVASDALFWLSWTLPDTGFRVQTSFALPGTWNDLSVTSRQVGATRRALLTTPSLPVSDTGNYFFRMRK